MNSIDVELVGYIKEAKKAGMTHEQIMSALKLAGWNTDNVVTTLLSLVGQVNGEKKADQAIIVKGVSKSFGAVKALENINLTIPYGHVLGLLGPNGAGKTTLVRVLATLLKPDSGFFKVAGYDGLKESSDLKSVIGLTGQFTAIDEYLTGRENLELIGRLYHLEKNKTKARAEELLNQFDLSFAGNRLVRTYSGGMRRRLDLAASLVNNPKVLFLDEPTTGLDPQSRIVLWGVIKKLVEAGTTVLLTTQYLEEADHLCDEIVVIDHGRIIARGTADILKSQVGGDVVEIHLNDPKEMETAKKALMGMGSDLARIDAEVGIIKLPAKRGSTDLIETVRLLDGARVEIADIMLRRPTLDDVFLSLTGHSTGLEGNS